MSAGVIVSLHLFVIVRHVPLMGKRVSLAQHHPPWFWREDIMPSIAPVVHKGGPERDANEGTIRYSRSSVRKSGKWLGRTSPNGKVRIE